MSHSEFLTHWTLKDGMYGEWFWWENGRLYLRWVWEGKPAPHAVSGVYTVLYFSSVSILLYDIFVSTSSILF